MADTKKKSATKAAATKAAAKPTRRQNAEKGFTASPMLTANLQAVLVDLIELSLQGKQAHWIIEAARTFSDTVAERMRALHATADGRSSTLAQTTSLPAFPAGEVSTDATVGLITERLETTVATVRDVHDQVDEEDPTSADILHAIIEKLEQFAWMVSAESRTPAAR